MRSSSLTLRLTVFFNKKIRAAQSLNYLATLVEYDNIAHDQIGFNP